MTTLHCGSHDPPRHRPSTAAPILAVLAVGLVTLGAVLPGKDGVAFDAWFPFAFGLDRSAFASNLELVREFHGVW